MFKTIILTFLALIAFAGNSILNRLAFSDGAIDAASFTGIRLFSGILFLLFLVAINSAKNSNKKINLKSGSWLSALFLFLYALTFSFAYITLDTGTGALILFGFVQITMIFSDFLKGIRLQLIEWSGLIIAFLGLTILLLPGASAPSSTGFALMALSGVAWGIYTLAGKGSKTPLNDTANNFLRTLPLVVILILFTFDSAQISKQGVILAIASGAITSGLGYAIWYSALAGLSVTQAAVIQLTVPIIAAIGGILFSKEIISLQLIISSVLVLGGVLIVVLGKQAFSKSGKT
ncbi:UNVERIFIED_CONTAM: hypothetical protein GTU68_016950 [Idotea baltica]|nr:hypothetical protein [Idotea baltica]